MAFQIYYTKSNFLWNVNVQIVTVWRGVKKSRQEQEGIFLSLEMEINYCMIKKEGEVRSLESLLWLKLVLLPE